MIRRLVLRNWRAYETADVGFEPGTTFVVAPNGIGKTSLLEAARWGLCGDRVDLPEAPVRLPAASAEVAVTVQLPGAQILQIHRELFRDPKKRPTVHAELAGRPLDADELEATLEEAWGATVGFIGRGAFLTETFRRAPEDRDLRGQLCRVFGVTDLEADVVALRQATVALEGELRGMRSVARAEAADLTRLEAELAEVEAGATAAVERLATTRDQFEAASARRDQVLRAAEAGARVAAWQEAMAPVLADAAPSVASPDAERLVDQLEAVTTTVEAELDALRRRRAEAAARIELIRRGLDELAGADTECPVCRRPLSAEDRAAAEAKHRGELADLEAAHAQLDDANTADRLAAVRALLRRVSAIGPRPPAPDGEPELAAAEADEAFERATAALEEAAAVAREAQVKLTTLTTELSKVHAADEHSRTLVAAHRHWALIDAARRSLAGTVDELLERQIAPLAKIVGDRWNQLFADRPDLRFDATGRLWRELSGGELPYPAFSAGEQTAARLLLQLVVLTSATAAPFCWVDEPLEHLDPTTRRLVAGMLSRGKRATGLSQLVVTTYEEDLARRLAAVDETTQVLYVRASGTDTAA